MRRWFEIVMTDSVTKLEHLNSVQLKIKTKPHPIAKASHEVVKLPVY